MRATDSRIQVANPAVLFSVLICDNIGFNTCKKIINKIKIKPNYLKTKQF